jgi:hypothetical protein
VSISIKITILLYYVSTSVEAADTVELEEES